MDDPAARALDEAFAAHLQARREAGLSGQDPDGVDRGPLLAAARAVADVYGPAEPVPDPGELGGYRAADVTAAYEQDPGDPQAAQRLASARLAEHLLAGQPIEPHVGG